MNGKLFISLNNPTNIFPTLYIIYFYILVFNPLMIIFLKIKCIIIFVYVQNIKIFPEIKLRKYSEGIRNQFFVVSAPSASKNFSDILDDNDFFEWEWGRELKFGWTNANIWKMIRGFLVFQTLLIDRWISEQGKFFSFIYMYIFELFSVIFPIYDIVL